MLKPPNLSRQGRVIAEEEEKISFQERFIVAVDDQPMNIDVLEMLLVKKLEREVVFCMSGEQAIEEVKSLAEST